MVKELADNGVRLTIGQLAKAAEVPTTTVRYYERAGLIAPPARSVSGYRHYDGDALEQLRFIKSAQLVGFTLEDIKALLDIQGARCARCQGEVEELLTKRLAEVDARLRDLKRVRTTLGHALAQCRGSAGECAVLKELQPSRRRRT